MGTRITIRSSPQLTAAFWSAQLVLLILITGCDSPHTDVYVDNKSNQEIRIKIPYENTKPSSVIKANTRSLAMDHRFITSGVDVIFENAKTGKDIFACRFTKADVDKRFGDDGLTNEFPPARSIRKIPISEVKH